MLNINIEHPDYVRSKPIWHKYRDLYAGGEQLREHAAEYLVRRSKEPNEVYYERLSRVFYENYTGSIIDWYAATLMRREPSVLLAGNDDSGKRFFSQFSADCDLKGTSLTAFYRQQFVRMLVYGETYMAAEFPRVSQAAMNRAEEEALGSSRA